MNTVMLANDWHRLTQGQWAAMLAIVLFSCALAVFLEYLSKPRYRPWANWRRRRR